MPSPFPGMDPFIEGQKWADFHHKLIAVMSEFLVPRVRPHYEVSVEKRVYVEHAPNGHLELIHPDVTMLEREGQEAPSKDAVAAATVVAVAPVIGLERRPREKA